jgi:para-aminobenzoate synthetase
MRTLIVDNYDSFTYNLFHLVADVTGVTPEVVLNDEPGWTLAELHRFDHVLLSAGPGRPERQADFGICADIIRAGQLPVLGVCLGHQGLCTAFGGAVEPAPEPVHGRISPVLHRQDDILAGLPSPFAAVRYHSLLATRLPAELEGIGWTPDGLLMALRHRWLPLWGVQFHPESICTEYGQRILRNFTELTRHRPAERRSAHRATAAPPGAVHRSDTREEAPVQWRLAHRKLDLVVAAERVFDACYQGSEYAFWLDSSLVDEPGSQFSFMGDASGPLARVATADVGTGQVTVRSAAGTRVVESSFFDWIDADLRARRVLAPDLPFDFALGWVGYLGYELKAECGATPAHRSPHPDAGMVFADRAIAFDHTQGTVYLLALVGGDDREPAEGWFQETALRLAQLAAAEPQTAEPAEPCAEVGQLELAIQPERYLELIAAAQQAIAAGETYEVCLTNALTADGSVDPWRAYRQLRRDNPAPFGALLRLGSLSVLGCSPERFVKVARDATVESKPIKGTRPRAASPVEDARLARELRESSKDRAENLMIVDLVRNDLGRCAEVGSVYVPLLFDVETYRSVHQLVSTVRARLRPDRSAVDCVRAAFPGGSMTGAPKLRTMAIIDDLEQRARGVYSGALGYFSLCGAADLAMVIRSLVVEPDRVSYGTGGAVIALSDPAAEFEETAVKATPILRLLDREFPGRSLVRA